jgi:hypothetical protein
MAYSLSDYVLSESPQLSPPPSAQSRSMVFTASGAITTGQWVNLDYAKTSNADKLAFVTVTDTSCGAVAIGVPVIGVAVETVADGEPVTVVVQGFVKAAAVATGSTSGLALALDTTTSGRATIADAANVNICGIALADAVSNVAPVMVTGYAF